MDRLGGWVGGGEEGFLEEGLLSYQPSGHSVSSMFSNSSRMSRMGAMRALRVMILRRSASKVMGSAEKAKPALFLPPAVGFGWVDGWRRRRWLK